jgi:hypothetical protein
MQQLGRMQGETQIPKQLATAADAPQPLSFQHCLPEAPAITGKNGFTPTINSVVTPRIYSGCSFNTHRCLE